MTEQSTTTTERPGWTVENFERFWANPDASLASDALADDVVGYWPGRDEPVRGRKDYVACIAAIIDLLPGMYLTVAEHARAGEYLFVRWIMHATGDHGPFETTGVDRIRVRDGQVVENVIITDTGAFQARSGRPLPWV